MKVVIVDLNWVPMEQLLIFRRRFLLNIRKESNGCWTWLKHIMAKGYGQTTVLRKRLLAHRASYMLLVGPIDHRLQLDHLCRNKACVNPSHLEQVTARENLLRGDNNPASINSRKTCCIHGHDLTVENIYYVPGKKDRICRKCRNLNKRIGYWRSRGVAPENMPPLSARWNNPSRSPAAKVGNPCIHYTGSIGGSVSIGDSRKVGPNRRRRRYECSACGHRWLEIGPDNRMFRTALRRIRRFERDDKGGSKVTVIPA